MASNSSKYPQLHDEAWLREQYAEQKRSTYDIATEVGCGEETVRYHLREFNIPRRGRWSSKWTPKACERCGVEFTPAGPAQRFCSQRCRAGTRECEQCGTEFRLPIISMDKKRATSRQRFCSKTCEYDWRKANITYEPTGHIRTRPDGYREINLGTGRAKNGRIKLHRHVMEQHLGRELFPDESVHHRDGDKANNDIANLELWVGLGKQPAGVRVEDVAAWAKEVIARYLSPEERVAYAREILAAEAAADTESTGRWYYPPEGHRIWLSAGEPDPAESGVVSESVAGS